MATSPAQTDKKPLPGLPRQPLTPQQQLEAVARAQNQADQRVRLGMQLFKAAEAHTSRQQELLDQVKEAQEQFRDQVNKDVARSLHAYDQWVAKIDEDFTTALRSVEGRINNLQKDWDSTQKRIADMMKRSEALLDQSRVMIQKPKVQAAKPKAQVQVNVGQPKEAAVGDTNEKTSDRLYRDIIARMNTKKKQAG